MSSYALWVGGFTFYAFVVIPTGDRVLGSHTPMGFITQVATGYLNGIGVVALLLSALAIWQLQRARIPVRLLSLSWLISAAILTLLIALHNRMDTALDNPHRAVLSAPNFYPLHEIYKLAYIPMWAASIATVWLLIQAWQRADRN